MPHNSFRIIPLMFALLYLLGLNNIVVSWRHTEHVLVLSFNFNLYEGKIDHYLQDPLPVLKKH